jgi:hypothetical protein
LGLKVDYITLKVYQLSVTWFDNFDNFLTAAVVGGVSDHRHNWSMSKAPSAGDWRLIRHFWQQLDDLLASAMVSELAWQARIELAQEKAESILQARWGQVQRLARELSYRGYLTGDEVAEFITRRLKKLYKWPTHNAPLSAAGAPQIERTDCPAKPGLCGMTQSSDVPPHRPRARPGEEPVSTLAVSASTPGSCPALHL